MPRASKPKDAEPGDAPAAAEPAGAAESAEPAEPDFENRAARRARGKGAAAQAQASGKSPHFGGRGSVQGPRQWGNRRSG